MDLPFVSVIIPCRNEAGYITRCLDSVFGQDYPPDKIEILVVDGMSTDDTRKIIGKIAASHAGLRLLDNPARVVPHAMNNGIREAHGDLIIRMDAHNQYARDYISKCVKYLLEYRVDNVGGVCITLPGKETVVGRAIALGVSHPFGVGNAHFRIGLKQPRYVDTVPFGCYRREVFQKIGLFDEDLVRNQDDEFNLRLVRNGGKILLVPGIISYYYARDTLKKLWKMNYQYGYFKPLVARKIGAVLTWRQLVPALFVGSLITSLILSFIFKPFAYLFLFIFSLYILTNIFASFTVAFKKGIRFMAVMPFVFFDIHVSYGIGYLKGIWDFIIMKRLKKKGPEDIPLTR